MAKRAGAVTMVSECLIKIDDTEYPLVQRSDKLDNVDERTLIFPTKEVWQEPAVELGDMVSKKQLLAKGVTRIFFQANVWVFAVLVILIGSVWGVGKAGVYKHIPDYFPDEVGVVGGMVGVLGGLGGFFCPIIFGYLLEGTGLWTSCWMFMLLLSAVCLIWMQMVIQKKMRKKVPVLMDEFEHTENDVYKRDLETYDQP